MSSQAPTWPQKLRLLRTLRETSRARISLVEVPDTGTLAVLKVGHAPRTFGDVTLGELAPVLWGQGAVTDLLAHERDVLTALVGAGVPQVLGFRVSPASSSLLTSVAPGVPTQRLPLPTRRLLLPSLTRAFAQTLARAHESAVVHRDLKPEHLFVDPDDGTTTIIDWEMAQHGDRRVYGRVRTSVFQGWEMSRLTRHPAERPGPTVDVFALGLSLWALATDRLPDLRWRGAIPPVVEELRALWPDVPPLLNTLIAAMTAPSPSDRPTCREIVAALDGDALPATSATSGTSATSATSDREAPETVTRARRAAELLIEDAHVHGPWVVDPELWLDLDLPALAPETAPTGPPHEPWVEALRRSGRSQRALASPQGAALGFERVACLVELALYDVAFIEARALLARTPSAGTRAFRLLLDRLLAIGGPQVARADLVALCAVQLMAHTDTDRSPLARLICATTHDADEPDLLAARLIALSTLGDEAGAVETMRRIGELDELPVIQRTLPWLPDSLTIAEACDWAWLELGHAEQVTLLTGSYLHRLRLATLLAPRDSSLQRDPDPVHASIEVARLQTIARLQRGEPARWALRDSALDLWLAARCASSTRDRDGALALARAAASSAHSKDVYIRTLAELEADHGHAEACVRALTRLRWPAPDDWFILERSLSRVVVPLTHEPSWEKVLEALSPYDLPRAAKLASELAKISMRPGPWVSRQLTYLLACGLVEQARVAATNARTVDEGTARHWRALLESPPPPVPKLRRRISRL